ncbi:hypothetical protein HMPREF1624_08054 [Sporothrix schenckii ATCC 58251]|uniref:ASX DEUBAD domain-containing protein n=1 Tax=Sporothrix schenckii (strain ATCC 58251 / de Perez 2211183) TaxID=1391915 RepID=U7PIT5_SPOS1|nr:hypothetical protein HMPREF1624_08054 [Sporothrix schenckii ATCC 58251]
MDYSSPLSSPPASSIICGYESDRDPGQDADHNHKIDRPPSIDPDEALYEVDFILTSPRADSPPGAEIVVQVDREHDEPIGEPVHDLIDVAASEPDVATIATEEIHSSPPSTANAFAVVKALLPVPKAKRVQKRESKQSQGKAEPEDKEESEEAPVQRSRARSKSETKTPARTPRKATSKQSTVVAEENSTKTGDHDTQQPAATEPDVPAVPAVTTTRSGRRVVQKHYGDEPSPPSAKVTTRTRTPAKAKDETAKTNKAAPSTSASAAVAVMRRRKQAAARWQTDFVLANTRSPLTQFDLRTLLCQPEAWDVLDADEKRGVLARLPPGAVVLDRDTPELARPDVAALENDNNFRHDCARYRSDLAAGFYNKQWLEEAFEAHAMRSTGLFDAYVLDSFESSWGVTVPDELRPEAHRAKKVDEANVVPSTSLKRGRRASKADEAKAGDGDFVAAAAAAIEARTSNVLDGDEAQPVKPKTTTETDTSNKSLQRQKQARVDTAIDSVEEASSVPAKRKVSVDIDSADATEAVDVPMRSRKRMTPSMGTGVAAASQGPKDNDPVEDSIEVGE